MRILAADALACPDPWDSRCGRNHRGLELARFASERGTVVGMPLGIFSNVGVWEILIILAVIMVLFGSSRLPTMGRSLGRGLREFKESIGETGREIKAGVESTGEEIQGTITLDSVPVEEAAAEEAAAAAAPPAATPSPASAAAPVPEAGNVASVAEAAAPVEQPIPAADQGDSKPAS